MSIEDPIVPKGEPAPDPVPARPWTALRWLWITVAAVVLISGTYLGLNAYSVPYYEYHPGSARATAPLIEVSGSETFPPEHDIAFTTITLRSSTAWSWIMAHFDDDVEIRTREEVLGDSTAAERREVNLQLMDTSKQDAVRSALVALGHDVPITIAGHFVVGTIEGTPAGELLEVGDVVVAVDGEVLDEYSDITRILGGRSPGDTVTLRIEHSDESVEEITVEMVAAEDEPDRGIVGVYLQPRNVRYEFPVDVTIDSGEVGGPSAGLAFTLGVLDVLTPGDLTGAHRVAVTGTIDAEGNVGEVGGVAQKTAAAIDAGFDVFIVPSAEVDMAVERAGDDLQVIGVDTLAEALDALASLGGSGLPSGAE